jgi:peptidoglycan-N-acetylglucosamine deacetylase
LITGILLMIVGGVMSGTLSGLFIRKSILANPAQPESPAAQKVWVSPALTLTPSAIQIGSQQIGLLQQQQSEKLMKAMIEAEQRRLTYSVPEQFQGRVLHSAQLQIARDAIALTFDDGPWEGTTDQILDILEQEGVKATFFWVGQAVQNQPEIAHRVVNAGHAIGNHTWHHRYEPMSEVEAASEIEVAAQIFRETTGIQTKLFRPPGGYLNNGLADYAISQGYTVVMWSVTAWDTDPHTDPQDYVDNVLADVQPGGIVLLHDGGGDRSKTVAALPTIIRSLKAQGYRFVTVPELLKLESDGW